MATEEQRVANLMLDHIHARTEPVHNRLRMRKQALVGSYRVANSLVVLDATMAVKTMRSIGHESLCPITLVMLQRVPVSRAFSISVLEISEAEREAHPLAVELAYPLTKGT